jgi:predicted amidophosphoribosyltransferase
MSNFPRKLFDSALGNIVRMGTLTRRALPQHCALCTAPAGNALICAACDDALPRLGPACPCCALPTPGGIVCGRCIARPPPLSRTHAVFAYAFPLDRLLQAMKYGGALAYADYFAGALSRGIAAWPDMLVALPLAPARQRQRGFNQAQEIARRLARLGGVPVVTGIRRTRDTPAQAALPWRERGRNVRNAFAALPARCRSMRLSSRVHFHRRSNPRNPDFHKVAQRHRVNSGSLSPPQRLFVSELPPCSPSCWFIRKSHPIRETSFASPRIRRPICISSSRWVSGWTIAI